MTISIATRPIDRQRAARLMRAFVIGGRFALDQVLAETDEHTDDHAVNGLFFALLDFGTAAALLNAGSEARLIKGLEHSVLKLTEPDG